MSEWTTDLRNAQVGWLVEQDCVGVRGEGEMRVGLNELGRKPKEVLYEVTKTGVVTRIDGYMIVCELASPGGKPERWVFGTYTKGVRVKAPEVALEELW